MLNIKVRVKNLVNKYRTGNPFQLAGDLGITIVRLPLPNDMDTISTLTVLIMFVAAWKQRRTNTLRICSLTLPTLTVTRWRASSINATPTRARCIFY